MEEEAPPVTIAEKSNRTRTRARFFKTGFVVYVVVDISFLNGQANKNMNGQRFIVCEREKLFSTRLHL